MFWGHLRECNTIVKANQYILLSHLVGYCIALLIFFGLISAAAARGPSTTPGHLASAIELTEPPPVDYRIIDQGGPRLVITNRARLGNPAGNYIDPVDNEPALSLEYPPHSDISYLFDAGLWIGGIVGTDTLVSTGTGAWLTRTELYPDTGAAGLLRFDDYFADQAFVAAYTDTLTEPTIVRPDVIDGLHRPLPVDVRQETRAWADPTYRNLIWLELTITNIGNQPIDEAYVGWYCDPDIYHEDSTAGYLDDLVGYRQAAVEIDGQTYAVEGVYAIDNDGDPQERFGLNDSSPTAAFGLAFIDRGDSPPVHSFNWWITNNYLDINWGPHRPATLSGRPDGDVARYKMMANGEIDYDQVFTGIDMTGDGWSAPPDTFFFAAGADIRFLYAVGPFDLPPGDSLTANFVIFIGDNLHTDPEHFIRTFRYDNPQPYLDGLDFSGWEKTLGAAAHLAATDFAAAAPGPPTDFNLLSWTTDKATLNWQPKGTFDLAGFEIFRAPFGDEFPVTPLAVLSPDDRTFTDTGLPVGQFSYAVGSFDDGGRHGPISAKLPVDLLMPMAVELYPTEAVNGLLTLTWEPSIYPDVAIYHIERFEESAPGDTILVSVGQSATETFADPFALQATIYEYQIVPESGAGIRGPASNRVRGMVMAFDSGPLIIDQTLADPIGLTDADSVRAFWERALPTATYRVEDRSALPTLDLAAFNPHPVTIVVSSGAYAETEHVRNLLSDYDLAGGRVLLVGRDLFNFNELTARGQLFGPGDFAYDFFGVAEIYYPPLLLPDPVRMNATFIGATPCKSDLGYLPTDPARTGWGIPAQWQPVGPGIPFVGWVEGDPSTTECLYTFDALEADTSSMHGKTVGLLFNDGRRRNALLSFPLSQMDEAQAVDALRRIIGMLGYSAGIPGDYNGDGLVAPVDLVGAINWILKGGIAPIDPISLDVNGDCRINLVDLVILVNYLYRSGPPLQVGC